MISAFILINYDYHYHYRLKKNIEHRLLITSIHLNIKSKRYSDFLPCSYPSSEVPVRLMTHGGLLSYHLYRVICFEAHQLISIRKHKQV
jgi:hypothetical protein